MYYVCKHFTLKDLVPKKEYYSIKNAVLWQMFAPEGLLTLDMIFEKVGPFYVNNWANGGPLENSGLRSLDSTVGAKWSGHKFGRCFDLHPVNMTGPELIQMILKNPGAPEFKFITEVELDTPTWAHISFRNWQRDKYGIHQIFPS
jgi:hypothetical protein